MYEFSLGTLKRREPRISWKEWLKLKKNEVEGKYPVILIFAPQKYPSCTLIFQDETLGKEVRRSSPPELYRELAKRLPKLHDVIVMLVIQNGDVKIQLEKKQDHFYLLESYGLRLVREKLEDVPF